MKRVTDYTQEELVELTREQIEDLVELQCAIDGVPLLPPEPVKPEPLNTAPDTDVYDVCGIDFESKDDAVQVAEIISKLPRLETSYATFGFERYVTGSGFPEVVVTPKQYMSEQLYLETKLDRENYQKFKEQYERLHVEYKEVKEARQESEETVYNTVNYAREEQDKILSANVKYNHYLKLAEGDKEIAKNFFMSSYPHLEGYLIVEEVPEP